MVVYGQGGVVPASQDPGRVVVGLGGGVGGVARADDRGGTTLW